jgi:hypothetical protein
MPARVGLNAGWEEEVSSLMLRSYMESYIHLAISRYCGGGGGQDGAYSMNTGLGLIYMTSHVKRLLLVVGSA